MCPTSMDEWGGGCSALTKSCSKARLSAARLRLWLLPMVSSWLCGLCVCGGCGWVSGWWVAWGAWEFLAGEGRQQGMGRRPIAEAQQEGKHTHTRTQRALSWRSPRDPLPRTTLYEACCMDKRKGWGKEVEEDARPQGSSKISAGPSPLPPRLKENKSAKSNAATHSTASVVVYLLCGYLCFCAHLITLLSCFSCPSPPPSHPIPPHAHTHARTPFFPCL